ncbi:MAG: 30S ribosomal protein S8e [archaeon]|nr:30S ribosomal protein S8e [archaeon]MCR4323916.1 30S ribosomal protein S8e [Nanoarchaeota archaeon]
MKQGRKTSGGRYKSPRKKKRTGRQSQSRIVKLGDKKTKQIRGRGGSRKLASFSNKYANVVSGKKSKKVMIKNVIETPSNTFLARQNILVKGAIIETELGKAKITNRPSQEGNVQAELLPLD